MSSDVLHIEHPGGPTHSAAPLRAFIEIQQGHSLLVSTESGFLNLTSVSAIALSAGSARVLEKQEVGGSIEPQDSVRLGEAVLARESSDGVLECAGLRYDPVTDGSGISGSVLTPGGWEEVGKSALLGVIELGIACLITEAVSIKESLTLPDSPEGLYPGI